MGEYIESIASIPIDVNRNLRLMKELDTKYQNLFGKLEDSQNSYVINTRGKEKRADSLDEIKKIQVECLGLSNEKVEISRQTEQIVKNCLEKLDSEIDRLRKKIQTDQGQDYLTDNKKKDYLGSYNSHQNKNAKYGGYQAYDKEYTIDDKADEPQETYCFCKEPYVGTTMIGCDYDGCKLKWFHLA